MLCGIAQSIEEMVLFRMLQGMFGAALVPLSQSVMLSIYPPERRGWAMSLWGMGVMIGPIMGPMLGGWLTEYYSWRWIFFINLPVRHRHRARARWPSWTRPRATARSPSTGWALPRSASPSAPCS